MAGKGPEKEFLARQGRFIIRGRAAVGLLRGVPRLPEIPAAFRYSRNMRA